MSYGNDYNHGQQQHYIPSDPVTPVGEYTPYASTDHFAAQDYIGQDSSGRRDVYPPRGGEEGFPTEGGYGAYEKGVNPVTRGSIAAQVRLSSVMPEWNAAGGRKGPRDRKLTTLVLISAGCRGTDPEEGRPPHVEAGRARRRAHPRWQSEVLRPRLRVQLPARHHYRR